jgi:hypothetical protein
MTPRIVYSEESLYDDDDTGSRFLAFFFFELECENRVRMVFEKIRKVSRCPVPNTGSVGLLCTENSNNTGSLKISRIIEQHPLQYTVQY